MKHDSGKDVLCIEGGSVDSDPSDSKKILEHFEITVVLDVGADTMIWYAFEKEGLMRMEPSQTMLWQFKRIGK